MAFALLPSIAWKISYAVQQTSMEQQLQYSFSSRGVAAPSARLPVEELALLHERCLLISLLSVDSQPSRPASLGVAERTVDRSASAHEDARSGDTSGRRDTSEVPRRAV